MLNFVFFQIIILNSCYFKTWRSYLRVHVNRKTFKHINIYIYIYQNNVKIIKDNIYKTKSYTMYYTK